MEDNNNIAEKKDKRVRTKKNRGKKVDVRKRGPLGFILRHKVLTVIIILLVVLIIRGQIAKKKAAETLDIPVIETAVIEKTDVSTTVSGTGKIVAATTKEIIVDDMAGQKIQKMNVQVGDVVKAGDVLCVFDIEELGLDLADAEAELNRINIQSNNSVATTKRNTTDTEIDKVTQTYRDIASVDEAQRILDTKKGELAEAQRIYDREYEVYREVYNEDTYYNLLDKKARDGILEGGELNEFNRQSNAKTNLELAKNAVDAAHTAVNTAQDNLTRAQESYTDNVRHGITSIENARDNLEDSYASNSTARLNTQKTIRGYESRMGSSEVIAPIDGIVTSIGVEEGNKYTSGALFKIEDAGSYIVEVNIDEYDISDVAVGQKVVIKTNATGDEELEGVVSKVAPKASAPVASSASSSTASTPSYKVTIDVLTKNDRLRMDMTAKIVITTNESLGVLAVPSDAVKTDGDGKTYINVSDDVASDALDINENAKRKIYVNVGIESSYYTAISGDGLKEGMTVYLNDDDEKIEKSPDKNDILGGI